jgi:hypothetical protein
MLCAMRVWLALVLLGCGGPSVPDDAGRERDAGSIVIDAGPIDAGPPFDAGNPCSAALEIDRTCTLGDDSTCAAVLHHVDCCGTYISLGITESERGRFANIERICEGTYPACGCAASPTVTDSGEMFTDPAEVVLAGCIAIPGGTRCMTYIATRPMDTR